MLTFFVAAVGVLGACSGTPEVKPGNAPTTTPSSSPAASPAASPSVSHSVDPKAPAADIKGKTSALEGKWPGIDGASLNVTKKGEKYSIEIKEGDKTATFEGTAKGDTIEFTRGGKAETIKASTAEETGMKWTAGEKNCVVITKGKEGYCRK